MTTGRPYRSAMAPDHARHELREDAARGWKSATLVEDFVSITLGPRPEPFVAPSPGDAQAFDLWRG
jgi:HD-GYP domain-containing protein (c-di-GMP phosphodiesterase class II)